MLKEIVNPILHPQLTFTMLKSDALRNKVYDKIITKLNDRGFVVYFQNTPRIVNLTCEQINEFYAEHVGRSYFPALEESVNGGVIPMILFRNNADGEPAFSRLRSLIGATNARNAEPDTIRAEFGGHNFNPLAPMAENAIHASDSAESAYREIGIIFPQLVMSDDKDNLVPNEK